MLALVISRVRTYSTLLFIALGLSVIHMQEHLDIAACSL
jgi:hypothetical protein